MNVILQMNRAKSIFSDHRDIQTFLKYFCDAYYVLCGYEKKENEFPFISVV